MTSLFSLFKRRRGFTEEDRLELNRAKKEAVRNHARAFVEYEKVIDQALKRMERAPKIKVQRENGNAKTVR